MDADQVRAQLVKQLRAELAAIEYKVQVALNNLGDDIEEPTPEIGETIRRIGVNLARSADILAKLLRERPHPQGSNLPKIPARYADLAFNLRSLRDAITQATEPR